ncbi:MAG TPA: N-acetylmuramoyl-L-alanine amidase, partial [Longimicrobiaceae bacterium]|nr:N-acetylmuramoyl-L-alanine amidase [Longimicrobiaceae bacterium]
MRSIRSLAAALAALSLLAACSDQPTSPPSTPPPSAPAATSQLDAVFEQAGRDFNVPASLLKAVGYVETGWEMVKGEEEFPGQEAAFGIMALRGERLTRGAALANVSEAAVKSSPEANIRAAAALLGAYAEEMKLNRADVAAWAPAVARYSGIESSEGQAIYVHYDVYNTLQKGVVGKNFAGKLLASLMPTHVAADFPRPKVQASAQACAPDYCVAGTVWRPSPNYNARPTGDIGKVHMVIIHTCEGSYTSCWSWLTNSSAQASAHYVVREDGAEISQLVREADRAWHIAATYDCSLNSSHECWRNGYSSNHFTVGIEHGGYASQSSFPVAQVDASAKLSCDISKAYAIPRDRYHYVAHGQLQPYNRTDPGPNWPWSDYMNRINSHCGTSSTSIIVDSNNNNNNTSVAKYEVSANWAVGSSAGYYGTGYNYASTQAISDPATFWFYLPAAATKTIDAWWVAGTNRSTTAPYIAWNASGTKLGTVQVNQQINGGKWNA